MSVEMHRRVAAAHAEMNRQHPWRKVVSTEFLQSMYSKWGCGSNKFILECGHEAYAKASDGEPKKKRCRECYHEEEKRNRETQAGLIAGLQGGL